MIGEAHGYGLGEQSDFVELLMFMKMGRSRPNAHNKRLVTGITGPTLYPRFGFPDLKGVRCGDSVHSLVLSNQ